MDTPTPPSISPSVPLTPLGARTPHAHPALYGVIAALSLVIIGGAAWLLWPDAPGAPTATPTPTAAGSGWNTYTNEQYGSSVQYPPSVTAGDIRQSDLGSVQNPVPGIYIGPLVFVPVTTKEMREFARASVYTDCPVRKEAPDTIPYFCDLDLETTTTGATVRAISVGPEGNTSRAYILAGPTDIYVDAGSQGYDFGRHEQLTREEYLGILSSLTFTGVSPVMFERPNFGLRVELPADWTGYRVVSDEGEGSAWHGVDPATTMEVEGGPMIVLRHSQWTEAAPRQDIPILVFTLEQWGHVIDGDWSLGAAPMPPTALARNDKYVFALPARYNYAFPNGWEEVDTLIQNGAVTAFHIDSMGFVKRTASNDIVFYDGWTSVSGRFSISRPDFNEFGSSDAISFAVDDATASRIPRVPGDDRDAWFRIRNDAEARTMLGIDPERFGDPSCIWQAGTASIEIGGYTEDLRPGETTDGAILIRVLNAQPPVCTGS